MIACPENEVFDSRDFFKPMLTVYEVELAFNSAREFCPQYFMDFRQILPGGSHYMDFKPSTDSDVSLISSNIRNCEDDTLCTDEMNALTVRSSGISNLFKLKGISRKKTVKTAVLKLYF